MGDQWSQVAQIGVLSHGTKQGRASGPDQVSQRTLLMLFSTCSDKYPEAIESKRWSAPTENKGSSQSFVQGILSMVFTLAGR